MNFATGFDPSILAADKGVWYGIEIKNKINKLGQTGCINSIKLKEKKYYDYLLSYFAGRR
jgi:hypothetical protein